MKYSLEPFLFTLLVFLVKTLFVLGDVVPVVQTGTQLFLNRFPDNEYENAVCNDGTKGGYYFSPSSRPEASDTFVIHLPGGGQCYDEASCSERWKFKPTSMSSSNFPASKFKKGFMDNSLKKTPFWSANKVMLGYCSSDGYMGDVSASKDTWGWHFRGQELVFAMIKELIAKHKLSSTSTVVFSGGSAGARGVMVLIDLLVADHFPKGAKVVGFLDSPYYIDVQSYSPLYKGFQYEESMKYKHMNTVNIISPECAMIYSDPTEQWKCQFGQYRMAFVKTSYFLISSQYDSYQLQMNTQTVSPYTKAASEYVDKFGSTLQNFIISLRDLKLKEASVVTNTPNIPPPTYAFFSWTCYNHDVSASADFYTMAVDEGVTQKDALEAFLKDSSLLVYSSTKGVVSSEIGGNEKKDYKKKNEREKLVDRGDDEKISGKGRDFSEEGRVLSSKGVFEESFIGPKGRDDMEYISRDKDSVKVLIGPLNKDISANIANTEGNVLNIKKDIEVGPKNKEDIIRNKDEKSRDETLKVRTPSDKHLKVRVHSWVDNCIGMNCGNSCPSIPRKIKSTSGVASKPLLSDHLYDIPSMGGGSSVGTGSQKGKGVPLSQYNAEFDSEEDSNEDEKPLFIPIVSSLSHVPSVSVPTVAAILVVAVPTPLVPSVSVPIETSLPVAAATNVDVVTAVPIVAAVPVVAAISVLAGVPVVTVAPTVAVVPVVTAIPTPLVPVTAAALVIPVVNSVISNIAPLVSATAAIVGASLVPTPLVPIAAPLVATAAIVGASSVIPEVNPITSDIPLVIPSDTVVNLTVDTGIKEPLTLTNQPPLAITPEQPIASHSLSPEQPIVSRSLSVHQALALSVYSSMAQL